MDPAWLAPVTEPSVIAVTASAGSDILQSSSDRMSWIVPPPLHT